MQNSLCCLLCRRNPFQDSNLQLLVLNEGFITAATDLLVHGVSAENTTKPLRRDASANLKAHQLCPKPRVYLSLIYIIVFVKVCYNKERKFPILKTVCTVLAVFLRRATIWVLPVNLSDYFLRLTAIMKQALQADFHNAKCAPDAGVVTFPMGVIKC